MNKLLLTSAVLAVTAGIVLVGGGIWGMIFTYKNVAQEKITTPSDASIPNAPVRGPFTLKAQADVIRKHTLSMTGGKVYAEMPRQISQVDANGKTVLVPNTARDIWITANVLTTALNLGIVTYAFSGLILFFGLVSIWTGITFHALSKQY